MTEPIRIGPTKGPRCVWGCDGYGVHARNCPDSPDYDPNWMDELTMQIKRDLTRVPAPVPASGGEPPGNRWRDPITGEERDAILARAWDCYVRDDTTALDARYAARDARNVALNALAQLAAAREEVSRLTTVVEDIERSVEAAGVSDENEAGDFLDLPTRVDLLADERDHLAYQVGKLGAAHQEERE